jgi:hypothetical protein
VAITAMSQPVNARDLLQRRCEGLMETEMARLSRRVPALRADQLQHVETTLAQVIDDLMLSRIRALTAGQLAVLFDLADAQ